MKNSQIVIVDDSPAILLVMKGMLSELGYDNVVTCSHPASALANIKRSPEKYSAVFTDLNMPDIDGMTLIKELGEMNYRGGVCIISDMENRVIELAAHIARKHKVNLVGNIAKPVYLNELQRMLNKLQQLSLRESKHCEPLSASTLSDYIKQDLIEPYYQPKVSLNSKNVEGIEVLARIVKSGQTNAIAPGQFIPTAIEHGLLNELTQQLLGKVLADFPKLVKEFGEGVKISLNLSPSQLTTDGYTRDFIETIDTQHVDKNNITLEITEEFALEDTEQLETINRLRMRGFGLSLDDFGTGFTNLNQLRTLPFTEVKIDRTLINDIHQDQFNQVVVDTLVNIAGKIDASLIAEGLEEYEDLEYLSKNYKDMNVQGYLICKPKPLDSLFYWHHSWLCNVQ
ncbi:EAL domain-containing response regulator [Vibrio europaeus]|uniref:EAL domain-containing response regulator n=1 Tax=Vibrio europaeus TaxID=300876 RepID=UPI00233EFDE5|nr:EAL domain-containing response regulator [Vibrio europaeus]MDC5853547.1 EAL domain-containing response regulator [Vibrio europaeus]